MLKLRYRKLRDDARGNKVEPDEGALERILNGAMEDVRLLLWKQKMFFAAVDEIRSQRRHEVISGSGSAKLNLEVVHSDNWQVAVAARAVFHADVVMQRNTTGHVHVFTNQRAGVDLNDLAQMLNLAEQETEGTVRVTDWKKLRAEGAIDDTGKWFYLPQFGQIHNGTESYPDTPATLLSDGQILELMRVALDKSYFDPERAGQCQQGFCSSMGVHNCPLHRYGLQRCLQIRYGMRVSQEV